MRTFRRRISIKDTSYGSQVSWLSRARERIHGKREMTIRVYSFLLAEATVATILTSKCLFGP